MKLLIIAILLTVSACVSPNNTVSQNDNIVVPILLDRPRMEKLINLMPVILRKSEEFNKEYADANIPDSEYNEYVYRSLYQDPMLSQDLIQAGFTTVKDYAEFYNVLIEMYILLSENPDAVKTAVDAIPDKQQQVDILSLKQASEPNNEDLKKRLLQMQYQLTVYKNLVLVNAFRGQLNSLSQS